MQGDDMAWIVYALRMSSPGHRFDGLIRYVGQTCDWDARWCKHCLSTQALGYSIRRNGRDAYVMEVLDVCATHDGALWIEVERIASLGTFVGDAPHGLNMTRGGDGSAGCSPSPETRNRMSESMKAAYMRDDVRAKNAEAVKMAAAANSGREWTDAQRAAASAQRTGRKNSAAHIGKTAAAHRGMKRSP